MLSPAAEYLAKLVLNIRSEEVSLKTEETRLKSRRDRLTKKREKLMKILDRECGGKKTDLGVATFAYGRALHPDGTRMPLILPENVIDSWIDPRGKPDEVVKEALTDMVFEKAE